jgi:hypothetical protein
MVVQTLDSELVCEGPCADCGVVVQRRIVCVDGMTHSRMELCEICWNVFRQRQVFAGGCCG